MGENRSDGEVASVACAAKKFLECRNALVDRAGDEVWCRGHAKTSWELIPRLFRKDEGLYDETAMFHSFRVRAPERHHDHRSVFDWLCLMQHYGAPTRLLDWTENFLFALYFAVMPGDGDRDEDLGRVHVLAPRRLNKETAGAGTIFVSDGFHVALRAVQARARGYRGWVREMDALECFPSSIDAEKHSRVPRRKPNALVASWLCNPVAVRPHRFNPRLLAQVGTFTLHAGKRYGKEDGTPVMDRLSEQCHRFDIKDDASNPFLRAFTVRKTRIREELESMGIHRGTLFPDLDGQTAYLVDKWRVETTSQSARCSSSGVTR